MHAQYDAPLRMQSARTTYMCTVPPAPPVTYGRERTIRTIFAGYADGVLQRAHGVVPRALLVLAVEDEAERVVAREHDDGVLRLRRRALADAAQRTRDNVKNTALVWHRYTQTTDVKANSNSCSLLASDVTTRRQH